jgi:predicted 2-oxoglutarate/Fe(II)-dependent dioxygenase YbiX
MDSSIQKKILKALEKVDRPVTFCASGVLPPTLPGLEVAGVGPIGLPLDKRQAALLRKQARQAPYGKGMKTLVDTDVRRVWEIDADQVAFANPDWAGVVAEATAAVQTALGLEKQKLNAHLYKLLLYEQGSFFLPHRDGEKLDRMVATLVIALPSPHEGGELVVRHEGRERTVDFGPHSAFQTQFAGFYADCEHEIRPVTRGVRLALVYNLTLENSNRVIAAPRSGPHIAAAAGLLKTWIGQRRKASASDDAAAPAKLAVLLDHHYTQAGLTHDALKGIDRARANILFAAAREAGCDASLALVTYWESGSAEPTGDYGYEYDDGDDDHEMGEVFDSDLTAGHFSDADGNKLAFGRVPLDDDEIVSAAPMKEREPDKEDFEGYTGNAGMTLDRWYHRAAVVLWPAESKFDVLCGAGVGAAVGGLEQMIGQWKQAASSQKDVLEQSCVEFAKHIMASWPERPFFSGGPSYFAAGSHAAHVAADDDESDADDDEYDVDDDDFDDEGDAPNFDDMDSDEEAQAGDRFISLLREFNDPKLITAWISRVLARDVAVEPGAVLGDLCARHGWTAFQKPLRQLFEATSNETLERHARLLADFALRGDQDTDRKRLCAELAERLMSALEDWDPRSTKRDWQARTVNRNKLLPPLIQALVVLEASKLIERLAASILARPADFDLTTVQVPVLLTLQPWLERTVKRPLAPLQRWLTAMVKELQSRADQPPQEPADWRREADTGCNCADCKELSAFLKNPKSSVLRLPLAQDRRRHLHQVIDRKKLDTTHATERSGRPFTLVCTKTKASYQRALDAHHVDLNQLAKMQELVEWHTTLSGKPARRGAGKSARK